MKSALVALLLIATANTASASCIAEAQVIAKVKYTEAVDATSCRLFIDPNTVKFYAPNQTCVLDLGTIALQGVVVGMTSENQCPGTLSTTVVMTESGDLVQD